LFVKAIKVQEKLGNLKEARGLINSLKEGQLCKTWKLWLEGALFEGRNGNKEQARKTFNFLLAQKQ
jgi:hypothetical protein